MTVARQVPLRFQVGARTIAVLRRDLVQVPLSLDAALSGRLPMLPPLDLGAQGYLVTSLPTDRRDALAWAAGGLIAATRQRYTRRYVDLTIGVDGYLDRLSTNMRSAIRRKTRKLVASGGPLDIRRFATPQEMAVFHPAARAIATRTYQERLLGAGLPGTPDFLDGMYRAAAAGNVRGWLLAIGGKPVAYLYCPIEDGVAGYRYVGHDPVFNDLSPGAVLQAEALRDLLATPGLKRFDFTEGDGQHKRQFATGGVDCVDLLLLRPSPANRAATWALSGFDGGVALARRHAARLGLAAFVRKAIRAG
ncbi:GNAT family N-acetyltransferase [uncultured Sphingomonas sp.]|uniref:GNAT family N-acetyltransferase n=1 Tax=uncultured Sphingomonas sp. TaxID=158754 RepID=UPI0035CC78BD